MATKAYFLNSSTAQYSDEEFAWFQTLMFQQGIIGDADTGDMGFLVTENTVPDMSVLVETGKALISVAPSGRLVKVVAESNAVEQLSVPANSTGDTRVDAIIIRVDKDTEPNETKNNIVTIELVTGSSASALSDAAIDTAVGNDGWVRVANIAVPNGASSILDSYITTTRTKVQFNDGMSFSNVFPVGTVIPFAGSSSPTGWLICDGTAVSRATYSDLFNLVGTTYGAGDGATTFNIPDLRGSAPIGAGQRSITFPVTAETETTIGSVATADASNNRLLLSSVAGLGNGDGVILTGNVPTGITAGQTYYVRVSGSYIYLYNDRKEAATASNAWITFTGTQTNATVYEASRTFTVDAKYANLLETGQAIVFDADTVPTGLTASTTYYIYKLTETTFHLATTLDKTLKQFYAPWYIGCLASTGVNMTFTVTQTTRTLGAVGGQEEMSIEVANLPKHRFDADSSVGTPTVDARDSGGDNVAQVTPEIGSNERMDNMQPYTVLNYCIKY